MKKYTILLFFIVVFQLLQAQPKAVLDTTKTAVLEIHLTNSKKQALQKEEVLVISNNNRIFYRCITDAKGNATQKIKAGYNYTIKLKTIAHTTVYGNIDIPALTAKQLYSTPFVIDMVYEPAKDYIFHNLEFDVAKATIKSSSYKELDLLVEYLQRKENLKIEITGHTDNVGNDNSNMLLSKQRADAVKSYLIKKGINTIRIKTFGLGASQPVAENDTEEGRQSNRRTELKFIE